MNITCLGQSSFCLEDENNIIIIDPWLSENGVFDHSWFQYPQNNHMIIFLEEKLKENKKKYIYVSNEEKNHFDKKMLEELTERNFQVIIPNYRKTLLKEYFNNYDCKKVIALNNRETFDLTNGKVTMFIYDDEITRNSGVLIELNGSRFLCLNNCPLLEKLNCNTNIMTVQFKSNNLQCLKTKKYNELYKKYNNNDNIIKSINNIKPNIFIPSGPPIFLDVTLSYIKFPSVTELSLIHI